MAKQYLVKFNADGERESSLTTVGLSAEEISQKQSEGFELVSLENFNKLLGNVGGEVYIRDPKTGEFVPKPPYVPTPEEVQEQIKTQLTNAVQNYLDATAQTRGYDNIHTACTYANSTDETFAVEGKACVAWRDTVWRTCYNMLDEVLAGQREIPTEEELIAELPELEW